MALATIIQRLCILNLEFSKAIAEPILTAVCSITDTKDDLEDLCHIILEVLRIRDDYWVNRADLILGWCTPYIVDDNSVTGVETERLVYQSTIFEIFPVECLLNYAYLYRMYLSFYLEMVFLSSTCWERSWRVVQLAKKLWNSLSFSLLLVIVSPLTLTGWSCLSRTFWGSRRLTRRKGKEYKNKLLKLWNMLKTFLLIARHILN